MTEWFAQVEILQSLGLHWAKDDKNTGHKLCGITDHPHRGPRKVNDEDFFMVRKDALWLQGKSNVWNDTGQKSNGTSDGKCLVTLLLQRVVYKHTPRVGTHQVSREMSHWGIPVGGTSKVGIPSGISQSHQLPHWLWTLERWYRTFCYIPPQWSFANLPDPHRKFWAFSFPKPTS